MPKRTVSKSQRRKTAHRLPSGSWRVQVYAGKKPDGKTRYESVTAATPEEALEQARLLEERLRRLRGDARDLTVGETIDRFIEERQAALSPSTVTGYRRLRRNALQGLMDIPLKKLTEEDIQREIDLSAASMSPKYLRNAAGLLTAALRRFYPGLWDRLHLEFPPPRPYVAAIPQEVQIKQIFQAAAGSPVEIPILLAMALGLRMGEARGVQFGDLVQLDQTAGLWVRRAIVDTESGPVVKQPKTASSVRLMPLPPRLEALIRSQPHENDSDFIVPLSGQAIYKRFSRLCQKNGLPHYRFHDLRHLYASVLLAQGVPDYYAQQLTGHSSALTLQRVYQHALLSKKAQAAQAAQDFFESLWSTAETL